MTIRPFLSEDYAAITRVHNANFAEFSAHADYFQVEDELRPEYCRWARWVAECDGHIVGFGEYTQNENVYQPGAFHLAIVVHPAYYCRGIGGRLYELVVGQLQRLNPACADEWSREDWPCRIGFLERRGFVGDMRMWTSELNLDTFEPSRFEADVALAKSQGIQLTTLADLGVDDPVVRRKLFELWSEVRLDVPLPPNDRRAEVSFEHWWARNDRPELLPDGYFVALEGERYVGTTQLWRSPEPGELRTGLTGVRRAYRRRGIAQALKVRSLAFGKAAGYTRAVTENETNNRGMIGINDRLGFIKRPAYVHFLKTWAD